MCSTMPHFSLRQWKLRESQNEPESMPKDRLVAWIAVSELGSRQATDEVGPFTEPMILR